LTKKEVGNVEKLNQIFLCLYIAKI
jgi:hypothetical protein